MRLEAYYGSKSEVQTLYRQIVKISFFVAILLLTTLLSCKTGYKVQTFEFLPNNSDNNMNDRRWISIQNDTTIKFSVRYGGLLISGNAKYVTHGNEILVDSLQLMEQWGLYNLETYYEIFGANFIRYKDSLVNYKTNDLYYDQRHISKHFKMKKVRGTICFIILDDKIIELTSFSYKRIWRKMNLENYDTVEISKVEARKLYDINEKYKTFKLTRKQ